MIKKSCKIVETQPFKHLIGLSRCIKKFHVNASSSVNLKRHMRTHEHSLMKFENPVGGRLTEFTNVRTYNLRKSVKVVTNILLCESLRLGLYSRRNINCEMWTS